MGDFHPQRRQIVPAPHGRMPIQHIKPPTRAKKNTQKNLTVYEWRLSPHCFSTVS
jgi:hypothetical protein